MLKSNCVCLHVSSAQSTSHMWSLLCLLHLCLYLIGQQDGKQLLWTKQHSNATCSPAVFPVQFLLFNPSKEIKEQYFHFVCPPAVSVTKTQRGGLSLSYKKHAATKQYQSHHKCLKLLVQNFCSTIQVSRINAYIPNNQRFW